MQTSASRDTKQQGSRREESLATANPTDYNVEAIAKLEQRSLHERSPAEKVSNWITRYTGSMFFVILHVIGFGVWVAINLNWVPGVPAFDPFPFGILTLIVSTEGVFLAIFILISQNHMTRLSDRRAHLDLQISMLAEQEMTMLLRMQQRVCEQLGIEVESIKEEARRLMETTDVQKLVHELEEKLPES